MVQLKYDVTPSNAPKFAADVVKMVQINEGVTLDYSVESLVIIDALLGAWHDQGCKTEDVEAVLFHFGCYVGEVFLRNTGAAWRSTTKEEEQTLFGVPLVVSLGGDKVANPIGKVIKRLQHGNEHNLPYFYKAFTQPQAGPRE